MYEYNVKINWFEDKDDTIRKMQGNLLHQAAANDDVKKVLSDLLREQNSADLLEEKDNESQTPLYIAASNGHLESVKLLLKAGANMYCWDVDGRSPIDVVPVGNNEIEIIKAILKNGYDVNIDNPIYPGMTHLHRTAQDKDNPDIVRLLIEAGSKVDGLEGFPSTPLHEALENMRRKNAKALLIAGANPNWVNDEGHTAFSLAIEMGTLEMGSLERVSLKSQLDFEILKLIIRQNFSPNKIFYLKKKSFTALSYFALNYNNLKYTRNEYVEIIELLLQKGADIAQAKNTVLSHVNFTTETFEKEEWKLIDNIHERNIEKAIILFQGSRQKHATLNLLPQDVLNMIYSYSQIKNYMLAINDIYSTIKLINIHENYPSIFYLEIGNKLEEILKKFKNMFFIKQEKIREAIMDFNSTFKDNKRDSSKTYKILSKSNFSFFTSQNSLQLQPDEIRHSEKMSKEVKLIK
jgi:ankyrin repeat protein